jgi:hypothetical protein
MGEQDFKIGEEVLVMAVVAQPAMDRLGRSWVQVEFVGRHMLLEVETDRVVRREPDPEPPEPQDWIDRTFGGPPPGTVEVGQLRWGALNADRRVMIKSTDAEGTISIRYFEVTD